MPTRESTCLFVAMIRAVEVDKRDEINIGKVSYESCLNEACDELRQLSVKRAATAFED